MEDCRELSECGAAVSPSPGGASLTRPTVGGSCRPGKAKPPPGITPLAKHHLRPARQPCRNGAKVIAAGNRDPRQLFRQRFLDQRRTGATASQVNYVRLHFAVLKRQSHLLQNTLKRLSQRH